MSAVMIASILAVNYLVIILLKVLKDMLDKKKLRKAFDKYTNISIRIFGFIVGAIGIDMVIKGILAFQQSGGLK